MCKATEHRAAVPQKFAAAASMNKQLPFSTKMYRNIVMSYRWLMGLAVFLNFVVFWALPIGLQGQGWRLKLTTFFHPVYKFLDENKLLRAFAKNYVYSKEVFTDFFALSLGLAINTFGTFAVVLYQQVHSNFANSLDAIE